jgi:hypothetical protein
MRKTITNFFALGVSLLCLFILGACAPDAGSGGTESSGNSTGQVIITNVPSKVKNGHDSFKIYVQLSTSTDDKDPHTAISNGKIAEHKNPDGSVTLPLYKDQAMTIPWEGSGSYFIAVTISPERAPSDQSIWVKVPVLSVKPSPFSSESNTIDWNASYDLDKLGDFARPRIQAIYERVIKVDPDITTK